MEKMQKNILSQSFMTLNATQEKKIKDLEEELQLVRRQLIEKDNLLQQQPPEVPLDISATEHSFLEPFTLEEDQPGTSRLEESLPGLGVQDPREADLAKEVRAQMQMETDEIVKECLQWERQIINSAALAYLTPKEVTADYHMPSLPYPLLKQEVYMVKKQYLPQCPIDQLGGYSQVRLEDWEVSDIMTNQPTWRARWFHIRPKDRIFYLNAPQELRIDPTFCPIKRRRTWENFQRFTAQRTTWLNYPELPPPPSKGIPTERYMLNILKPLTEVFKGVPDLACIMLVKIAKMIVTAIEQFNDMQQTGHPWTRFFEGMDGLCWNLQLAPPKNVLMGLYARIIFLPAHFLVTFEEAFYTGFFEIQTNIFSPINQDLRSRFVAFQQVELKMPLRDVLRDSEQRQRIQKFQRALDFQRLHGQ